MSLVKSNGGGLGGSGSPGGALGSFFSHTIDQSLRLNRADSAHLYKTWGADADSNKIFTFSIWVKRHGEGDGSNELTLVCSKNTGAGTGQGSTLFGFYRNSNLMYYTENGGNNGYSKALFRDPGAWMHLCWQYDTTQSTASNRIRFYINGVQNATTTDNWTTAGVPAEDSVMTSMNQNTQLNAIGAGINNSVNFGYFDGYIAEVIMLDGVTTDCTAFGEFSDGIWIPKAYSGSFGTNGYHLDFADNTDIGKDVSGRGNHWTSSGLAATDVVPDSPTNNFATMNPLSSFANLLEGNLKVDPTGWSTSAYGAVSTIAIPKDKKIYVEIECTDTTGGNWTAGFATKTSLENGPGSSNIGSSGAIMMYNRQVEINDEQRQYTSSDGIGGTGVSTFAAGDILGMMIDGATGKVWFSRNGTYFKAISGNNTTAGNVGDPNNDADELGTITGGTTDDVFVVVSGNSTPSSVFVNFGQDSTNVASANADANGIGTFEYAPPTDYVALCSSNMSDITIGPGQSSQADDHFNTVIWTGDGNTSRAITGVGFAPNWMWLKSRSHTEDHALEDTVRGVGKKLDSSGTEAEETTATAVLSAHGSDGFTLPASTPGNLNVNARTYVAWNWKAGGKADTFNIDGTGYSSASDASLSGGNLTPTGASISTTAGFGIIGYTGNGSANQTIKHGLSSPPELIIIKDRDTNSNNNQWQISSSVVGDDYAYFTTAAFTGTGLSIPTSGDATTITLGRNGTNLTNESGDKFIMYLFHSVEGYIKVGTFKGNGVDDGPFVYTGFRPAWVMTKRTDSTNDWHIMDDHRNPTNVMDGLLFPNLNNSETSDAAYNRDFLSNGFKIRGSESYVNASGGTFVYLAFAHSPFKFANAF